MAKLPWYTKDQRIVGDMLYLCSSFWKIVSLHPSHPAFLECTFYTPFTWSNRVTFTLLSEPKRTYTYFSVQEMSIIFSCIRLYQHVYVCLHTTAQSPHTQHRVCICTLSMCVSSCTCTCVCNPHVFPYAAVHIFIHAVCPRVCPHIQCTSTSYMACIFYFGVDVSGSSWRLYCVLPSAHIQTS